ncbi:hypothetical protein TIFTF001_037130 [Ficus carica]|nr:hypothetical protein TIFTF001_037112 [Ficus carica]GMN68062.1 hypothetical protein TIFTF001_037115 [Ficus carica]GMN68068.1 hypothetical protein TIFTF001_037130 [Ficus carica]
MSPTWKGGFGACAGGWISGGIKLMSSEPGQLWNHDCVPFKWKLILHWEGKGQDLGGLQILVLVLKVEIRMMSIGDCHDTLAVQSKRVGGLYM